MLLSAKRMYVNNPTKRIGKSGKPFYTFFTSLGMFTKGSKAKMSKGTLNCITFLTDVELKHKMLITNVLLDLYVEKGSDNKAYFKATITKFDTENLMKQPDIEDTPVDAFNDDNFSIPEVDEPKEPTNIDEIPTLEEIK